MVVVPAPPLSGVAFVVDVVVVAGVEVVDSVDVVVVVDVDVVDSVDVVVGVLDVEVVDAVVVVVDPASQ